MNVKLSSDFIKRLTRNSVDRQILYVAPGVYKMPYKSDCYNLIIESFGFRLKAGREEDDNGYYVYRLIQESSPQLGEGLHEDVICYAHSFIEAVATCYNYYLERI